MEVGTYAITLSSKPNQRTNGAVHLLTESVSRTSRILVESQYTRQEAGFNNCNLVKPLDLNKARDYGDLGWQLHQLVKQSAPRSRQITTPTPHHSVFYRPIGLTALVILQLNVEGLSAAKRSIIRDIAGRHNVDVICLQETRAPLTKFEAGLNLLHKVDDHTVMLLESAATAALVK